MPEKSNFDGAYEGITDLKTLILKLKELDDTYRHHKDRSGQAWHEMEYLKKTLLPDLMGDKTLIKWDDFPYRLQKRGDLYAKCAHGVTEEVKDWLFENEGEALVSDTVNSSALKAWIKRRLAAGKPIPTELFAVEPYEVATVVKV